MFNSSLHASYKNYFMKNFVYLFSFFLGFGLLMSCSDDETPEATFGEKFGGEWTITFAGDLTGSIPLTVNDAPGMGSGVLPITIEGFTVNYDVTTNITENGALTIDFNTDNNGTGASAGTLTEAGSGTGTYNIQFINTDNGGQFPLAGDWSAIRN